MDMIYKILTEKLEFLKKGLTEHLSDNTGLSHLKNIEEAERDRLAETDRCDPIYRVQRAKEARQILYDILECEKYIKPRGGTLSKFALSMREKYAKELEEFSDGEGVASEKTVFTQSVPLKSQSAPQSALREEELGVEIDRLERELTQLKYAKKRVDDKLKRAEGTLDDLRRSSRKRIEDQQSELYKLRKKVSSLEYDLRQERMKRLVAPSSHNGSSQSSGSDYGVADTIDYSSVDLNYFDAILSKMRREFVIVADAARKFELEIKINQIEVRIKELERAQEY